MRTSVGENRDRVRLVKLSENRLLRDRKGVGGGAFGVDALTANGKILALGMLAKLLFN